MYLDNVLDLEKRRHYLDENDYKHFVDCDLRAQIVRTIGLADPRYAGLRKPLVPLVFNARTIE
jgi:hypothetical protein